MYLYAIQQKKDLFASIQLDDFSLRKEIAWKS